MSVAKPLGKSTIGKYTERHAEETAFLNLDGLGVCNKNLKADAYMKIGRTGAEVGNLLADWHDGVGQTNWAVYNFPRSIALPGYGTNCNLTLLWDREQVQWEHAEREKGMKASKTWGDGHHWALSLPRCLDYAPQAGNTRRLKPLESITGSCLLCCILI
ncbi:hypothetical protein BDZ91DRAFT_825869 [Kalaharituber pfeilii]|nr:hypothetical protein BDZ91DRAFT_825869 [Kalaharituber pfeilii]